jgi:endonuclease III
LRFRPALNDPPLQLILLEQDPSGWRMLVGCILLNASNRRSVDRCWPSLFRHFPDANDVMKRCWRYGEDWPRQQVARLVRGTGCQVAKAKAIVELSHARSWREPVSGYEHLDVAALPGCGPYAQESWDVFVCERRPLWADDHVIRSWVELTDHLQLDLRGRDLYGRPQWTLPRRLRGRVELPAHQR